MSSWAAVASAASKPKAAAVTTIPEGITAVVDANAIIGGMQLDRLGDTAVTIPAVLAEIRDAASRQRLATLPLGITTMEPDEESISADMRVLALAHMLTILVHGGTVLRDAPPPPKAHAKARRVNAQLPGWGAEGEEWDALDALPDVADGPGSRIATTPAQLQNGAHEQQHDAAATIHSLNQSRDGEGADVGEDVEWEVAASSRNALRRRRRKALRHAERQVAVGSQQGDRCEEEDQDFVGEEPGWADNAEASDQEAGHNSEEQEEEEEEEQELQVKLVTADFAMQNVALQMGMSLVAPDGVRIRQLNRWVLRCTACFTVSQEMGRLFCPKCGNTTMHRVHVVVCPDGSEAYGARPNGVLKGTRFPLPAPKGGRSSKDPILSEDMLMLKAQRMRRMAQRNKGQGVPDPFAPEFNEDSWFQSNKTNTTAATEQLALAQAANMSALLANAKHNPNERSKAHRTNRRK